MYMYIYIYIHRERERYRFVPPDTGSSAASGLRPSSVRPPKSPGSDFA